MADGENLQDRRFRKQLMLTLATVLGALASGKRVVRSARCRIARQAARGAGATAGYGPVITRLFSEPSA